MSTWIVPIIISAIAAVGTWGGVRWGRKGERENALIDQLQEDLTAVRARLDAQEGELQALRLAVVQMQSRDAQWEWHTERIEGQVVELGGIPHPRPLALRPVKEIPGD